MLVSDIPDLIVAKDLFSILLSPTSFILQTPIYMFKILHLDVITILTLMNRK